METIILWGAGLLFVGIVLLACCDCDSDSPFKPEPNKIKGEK